MHAHQALGEAGQGGGGHGACQIHRAGAESPGGGGDVCFLQHLQIVDAAAAAYIDPQSHGGALVVAAENLRPLLRPSLLDARGEPRGVAALVDFVVFGRVKGPVFRRVLLAGIVT